MKTPVEHSNIVLVVSDFHLGPGRHSGEFEHFDQDDPFAEFLSHYARAIEYPEVHLVIAGDFFDSIQVMINQILLTRVYGKQALEKIRRIVNGHPLVFDALRDFCGAPGRKVTFLTGNHDPSLLFPEVHKYLREQISSSLNFELRSWSTSALTVVHGNEWDAANRFSPEIPLENDASGDFVRFPWGSLFVIGFVSRVRKRIPDIDKIKPLGAYIRWSFTHRPFEAVFVLLSFIGFVLHHRFHSDPAQRFSLKQLYRFLRGTCYSCTFIQEARTFLQANRHAILVAGHTHRAVATIFSDREVYLNTGTWNPILMFRNGVFHSELHRTFGLIRLDRIEKAKSLNEAVELLEWVPGKGASKYSTDFFNVHMHTPPTNIKQTTV